MQVNSYIRRQSMVSSIALFLLAPLPYSQAQSRYVSPIPLTPSSCAEARDVSLSGIKMSEAKRFRQAIEQFEAALKLCPEDENAALDVIQTTVDMRDYPKTESAAKALLAHHPDSETGQVFLAYSYLLQGKSQDAAKTLQKLLAQDGKNPDGLKLMGLTLYFYKEYTLAEKELSAALTLQPTDERALYALGRVYQEQNNFPPAIQCFKRLIAHDPYYYRAYVNLALCYEAQGKIGEADATFKAAEQVASKVNPSYDWAYSNHAEMLIRQGQTDEALQYVEKAVQLNPRSARDQLLLGKLLLAKDDLAGAEEHLRTSIQLDEGLAEAHYLLGRVYQRAKEPAKAQQEFARFKQLSEKTHVPGVEPLDSDRE
jgi:tetratricopeptide (TPR) repeat protein